VAILGYHRIAEAPHDPFGMAVAPDAFDAQLGFLARNCRPVSLSQAIGELARVDVPAGTVVVTLDDGYADTLDAALPVMRRHGVPATVFACTGYGGDVFWWDRLASLASASLPQRVEIDVGATRHDLTARDSGTLLHRVARLLEPANPSERDHAIGQLSGMVAGAEMTPTARALTHDELATLATDPLIEIGGHTITHPLLARLPEAEQRREIVENRAALVSITGQPVRHFAYPHGSLTALTTELVRSAGYDAACCSEASVATPDENRHALPRLWVDGKRDFSRWIRRWLS
jgi:peptidoglycan/xylan/chitin deacetylase (PgdA/CDA1 family)